MKIRMLAIAVIFHIGLNMTFADGVVSPDATALDDAGSSGSIAEWTVSGNHTTADSEFVIGGSGKHYNRLTVAGAQTFTASAGLVVGPANGGSNFLTVEENGSVVVVGNTRLGTGSISYFSTYSRIDVSGLLQVSGDLDIANGYNADNNTLSLHAGGMAKVDGDFFLYNHWSYGNCWLELDGGMLAIAGDKTAEFEPSDGILTSIKIWDDVSGSYEAVADFDAQAVVTNSYFSRLSVSYISDAGNPLDGYTVVEAIPEPATLSLIGLTGLGLLFLRRFHI